MTPIPTNLWLNRPTKKTIAARHKLGGLSMTKKLLNTAPACNANIATTITRNAKKAALLAITLCAVFACALALAPSASASASALAPARAKAELHVANGAATVTLPDGRIFMSGGQFEGKATNRVQVIETRANNPISMESVLQVARSQHTATLLPSGEVLVLGGAGDTGALVTQAERFNPVTGVSRLVALEKVQPRMGHTVTVVTDGRLVIAGGRDAVGRAISSVQILNPETGDVQESTAAMQAPRQGHEAFLLADGRVLIVGGRLQDGSTATYMELFDAERVRFVDVPAVLPRDMALAQLPPNVTGTIPPADAVDVAPDTLIAFRFSTPMTPETVGATNVTLIGREGHIPVRVVPTEDGMLAFVRPEQPLLPAARYNVFLNGLKDANQTSLALYAMGFTTGALIAGDANQRRNGGGVGATSEPIWNSTTTPFTNSVVMGKEFNATVPATNVIDEDGTWAEKLTRSKVKSLAKKTDDEEWIPGPEHLEGRWRSHIKVADKDVEAYLRSASNFVDKIKDKARRTANRAAAKPTTLTGQVLRLNGKPLKNAMVSLGDNETRTDGTGRFTLVNVPAGRQEIYIEGHQAGDYGSYLFGVDIDAGEDNDLDAPVWMPKLDKDAWFNINSPTTEETVVKSARLPGLEIRIPKGVIIRDHRGRPVTRVNLTPMPIDTSPFPVTVNFSLFFSLQPAGSTITSATSGGGVVGAKVTYPNYGNLKPGTSVPFYDYDSKDGWYFYGSGKVAPDAKQIIPGPEVVLYRFMGFSIPGFNIPDDTNFDDPCPDPSCDRREDGDPVDLSSGIFVHRTQDFAINDLMPVNFDRTYRVGRKKSSRGFGDGVGNNFSYYLRGDGKCPNEYVDLVFPNGSYIRFLVEIGGQSIASKVYRYFESLRGFRGSTLTSGAGGAGGSASVTLPSGITMGFAQQTCSTTASTGDTALKEITDRLGNKTTISRNNGGLISRIKGPSGRLLNFAYDTGNRVQTLTDDLGRSVTYTYTSTGTAADGTPTTGIASVSWKNAAGVQTHSESYTYDAAGRMATVTDQRGILMVSNIFYPDGRVQKQTLADGAIYQFAYTFHANGKVATTTVTDGRNNVRTLTYTDKSQLVNETFGAGSAVSQTSTYTRNTQGLIASVTDHRSRRKEFLYDTNGNITQITYLAGTANAFTEKFTYTTDYNKVKTYTDPRGKITTMTYDAKGNVTQVKDPLNNVTNMTYDSQGHVLTMTSGSGGNTITRTYTYDVNDVRTVTEGGYTSTFTTDTLGRVTAMTDGRGNVSYYEYDNRSRLTKATDPNGKITQLQYDGNGNITKVTDAANAITQYAYDPRNRLTSITDPFNVVEQWTWDNKGNLATYKDRRNKTTTFSYDALDRLSGTIYADATSTTFGYSYPAGGLAEMTMSEGTKVITRRFDNRDRLSYEVTPQGRIDYAYDAADRRSSMTVQNQTPITYTWDDGDRVTVLTQGARSIALAYDQANRRSKITFPGTLEQRMTYAKPWGRPSAISYFAGATPVQLDALTDATFDGDGRPITRTATAAANGIPNAVNTLPTAFTASYTNNRLTTFNGAAWTYDTQGNLTGDGTNTYVWDVRNRLTQIKQGATVTASFEYDALNRRTKKIIGTASTEYLHDGLTPVQEKRVGDITQLITGPGIDDYLSRITTTIGATPTTTTRNYLTDFLGSTTALADDAGAIKTTYGYEPYGEATVAGEATVNSFQYTGRENDGTGLYYYRARYYSPKAKRFISEDPIGQNDGPNVYGYVEGDPLTYNDPTGEFGLVGALGSAGFEFAIQLVKNKGNIGCVDWGDVLAAGVTGFFVPKALTEAARFRRAFNASTTYQSQLVKQTADGWTRVSATRFTKIRGRLADANSEMADAAFRIAGATALKQIAKEAQPPGNTPCECK
jgi:RHS repeat-associated protein